MHISTPSEVLYDLVHAKVGTSKEKLDLVNLDLPVITVDESKWTSSIWTCLSLLLMNQNGLRQLGLACHHCR